VVATLLAKQFEPAHRQQHIFYNQVDDREALGYGLVARSFLLVLLVIGVFLPVVITSYRL